MFKKGQITTSIAIISAVGIIVASAFTSWATASGRISSIETEVQVVTEREDNHYQEVKQSLDRIEKKLDAVRLIAK